MIFLVEFGVFNIQKNEDRCTWKSDMVIKDFAIGKTG